MLIGLYYYNVHISCNHVCYVCISSVCSFFLFLKSYLKKKNNLKIEVTTFESTHMLHLRIKGTNCNVIVLPPSYFTVKYNSWEVRTTTNLTKFGHKRLAPLCSLLIF